MYFKLQNYGHTLTMSHNPLFWPGTYPSGSVANIFKVENDEQTAFLVSHGPAVAISGEMQFPNAIIIKSNGGRFTQNDLKRFHKYISLLASGKNLVVNAASEQALVKAADAMDRDIATSRDIPAQMESIGVYVPNYRQLNRLEQ